MENIPNLVMLKALVPKSASDVPNAYRELIEHCWSQNAEERPTFDEIVNELKTNDEFITEVVDSEEFYDYIDFIDNSQITFNDTKKIIHFSDFIKAQGRNKIVKPVLFNESFRNDQTINDNQLLETETMINKSLNAMQDSDQDSSDIKEKDQTIKSTQNLYKIVENDNESNTSKNKVAEEQKTYNLMNPFLEFTNLSK